VKNKKGIKNRSFFFLISFLFLTSLLSIKTLKKVDTQDIRISGSELFSQNDVIKNSSLNFPIRLIFVETNFLEKELKQNLSLKNVSVNRELFPFGLKVYTPLVENMPSSTAIRPGDVLKMRNGKTVEVLNTDAEGRLIMADALAFAAEKKPDLICDVATLTGAAYVALGVDIGAVISNSEKYSGEFIKSNKNQVESYHELPLFQGYKSLIKSSIADMKNTGGRFGGAITAALILEEFVDETPWVHLDIAGPARARSGSALNPEGGTGFGVIGFLNFFKLLSKNYQ